MGFLDKAKKLAEQAQTKLDDAQRQFNERQAASSPDGPVIEYDQHGRPVPPDAPPAPPEPAAQPEAPPPEPAAPPGESSTPPHGDPLRDADEYAPPKLTGGDPLAG